MKNRLKQYRDFKESHPEVSLKNMKAAINALGLNLVEKPVRDDFLFSSCILSIVNPKNNQPVFSTYGKGITYDWARVSAWGEMLERIQNLAFYMIVIYPTREEKLHEDSNEFEYYPDERVLSLSKNSNSSFAKNYQILIGSKLSTGNLNKKVIGVPFVDLFKNNIEYLPFRVLQVIVGSNGMCCGNTRAEALIQGISEVYERYVLKFFYLKPFCPPDIPLKFFEGTEIHRKIIALTEQYDYKVQIKDCSLGKGYPVIGMLLIDLSGDYAFHLGADPNPVKALEKCVTEMCQGGRIDIKRINELYNNLPYNLESDFWKINLSLTISAYAGHWPDTVLHKNPSYEFTEFYYRGSGSDEDDLKYLLRLLKKENREIFIRDNSYLGMHSYYVYIPGMSEITNQPDNAFSMAVLDFDNYLPSLLCLAKTTQKTRLKMKSSINTYIEKSPNNKFRINEYFAYCRDHPIAKLSDKQFLLLIDLSLFEGTIKDNFVDSEVSSIPFIKALLKQSANRKLADIFQMLNIPPCFNCKCCSLTDKCNLSYILDFWECFKDRMRKNSISQIDLLGIYDLSEKNNN